MEYKYYDRWEFNKINDQIKISPLKAKKEFEEYIEIHPEDYMARSYYVYCLITLKEIKKAEKELNKLKQDYTNNPHFAKQAKKIRALKYNTLVDTLRIFCQKEEYEKAYGFYSSHQSILNGLDNSIMFYCRKKLGKLDPKRRNDNSYLFRQITEYQESDFLNHIKKHLADYNKDLDEPNKNIFVPDFPIDEILTEIKKYIPGAISICPGFLEDVYHFKYEECGRENNKLVNYFKVVCFHNTTDIITICPISYGEDLPYIDLSYMNKNVIPKEIKRLSAIDRFNKKYNRK